MCKGYLRYFTVDLHLKLLTIQKNVQNDINKVLETGDVFSTTSYIYPDENYLHLLTVRDYGTLSITYVTNLKTQKSLNIFSWSTSSAF